MPSGVLGGEEQGGLPGVRHLEGRGGVQQPAQAPDQPRLRVPRVPSLSQPQAFPVNPQDPRENRSR